MESLAAYFKQIAAEAQTMENAVVGEFHAVESSPEVQQLEKVVAEKGHEIAVTLLDRLTALEKTLAEVVQVLVHRTETSFNTLVENAVSGKKEN